MKLTFAQHCALVDISAHKIALTCRQIGCSLASLRALQKRKLVEHRGGSGHFATWSITDAGRRALETRPVETGESGDT